MHHKEKQIKNELQQLAATYGPDVLVYADVLSVDETARTCDVVTVDDVEIKGVLLQSEEAANIDILLLPAVDSRVLVGNIENSADWVVIKCGALQAIKINCTAIEFNGGTLGGIPKRDGVKAQLNKLEQDVNNLKTVFSGWTPVPNDGGAALKASVSSWAGATLTQTVNGDIENTQIKQ